MTLYASAQTSPETRNLLRLYHARLRSNLVHALRPISPSPETHAEIIAALIDGLYLRAALPDAKSPSAAQKMAEHTLSILLEPVS